MQQQKVHMTLLLASTRCCQTPKLKEQRGQLPKHFVLRPQGKHHPAENNLLEPMLILPYAMLHPKKHFAIRHATPKKNSAAFVLTQQGHIGNPSDTCLIPNLF